MSAPTKAVERFKIAAPGGKLVAVTLRPEQNTALSDVYVSGRHVGVLSPPSNRSAPGRWAVFNGAPLAVGRSRQDALDRLVADIVADEAELDVLASFNPLIRKASCAEDPGCHMLQVEHSTIRGRR